MRIRSLVFNQELPSACLRPLVMMSILNRLTYERIFYTVTPLHSLHRYTVNTVTPLTSASSAKQRIQRKQRPSPG